MWRWRSVGQRGRTRRGPLLQCLVSVPNLVRYDRYMQKRLPLCLDLNDLQYEDFAMEYMANRIALPLDSGGLGAEDCTVECKTHEKHLASGDASWPRTTRRGTHRGKPCKWVTYFICRKYCQKMRTTCWMGKGCGMPLCRKDHRQEPSRNVSCLVEHRCSGNEYLGCGILNRAKKEWIMPNHLKVFHATRTGGRK